jgi:hypothetical protein
MVSNGHHALLCSIPEPEITRLKTFVGFCFAITSTDQWSQWYWKWSLPLSNTFSNQIIPSTSGGANTKKWQWDAFDQRVFLSALRCNKHKDQLLLLSTIVSRERNCGASEIQIETRNPSSWLHYFNVWTPHGVDQLTGGTVHVEAVASIQREGGEGILVHGSTFLSRGSPNESLMRVMLPRSSGSKWMYGLVLHKIADKPSIVKGVVESPKAKQSSHPFVGFTAVSPSTKWDVMVRAVSRGTGKNLVGEVFNGMTGLEVRTDFKTKLSRHTFIRNKTYHYHGSSTAASPCLSVHSELTHEIPSRAVITTGVHSASITNGRGEHAVTKFGLHNSLYCDVYGFRLGLWGDWDLGGAHTVGATLKL